jgi:hypothetical protein
MRSIAAGDFYVLDCVVRNPKVTQERAVMKILAARLAVTKAAVLTSLLWFAVQGCGIPFGAGVKSVPVQDVDRHGTSLARLHSLERGDKEDVLVAILGEPADRRPSCVPGQVIWRYPIRAWNKMLGRPEVVLAVLLRINFDRSGVLTDWGFVDPLTGRSLVVRETLEEASRWFQSLSLPPVPPYIELHKALVRGQTTQDDVERVRGQWQPDLFCGNGGPVPVVSKRITQSDTIWDWYVDRPSPLFVPPHYLVASFDDTGALIVWHFEGTYPGGRK